MVRRMFVGMFLVMSFMSWALEAMNPSSGVIITGNWGSSTGRKVVLLKMMPDGVFSPFDSTDFMNAPQNDEVNVGIAGSPKSKKTQLLNQDSKTQNLPVTWFFFDDLQQQQPQKKVSMNDVYQKTFNVNIERVKKLSSFVRAPSQPAAPSPTPSFVPNVPTPGASTGGGGDIKDPMFTLASCNILYQSYYYGFNANQPNVISLADRQKFFNQAFNEDLGFKNAQILCFQEWAYHDPGLQNPKSILSIPVNYYTKLGLNENNFARDGVCIFYKDYGLKKIAEIGFELDNVANRYKNKSVLIAAFELLPGFLIGIITGHFGGIFIDSNTGIEKGRDDFKKQLQWVSDVCAKHPIKNWIICGDFNSNEVSLIQSYFPEEQGWGWKDVFDWDIQTHLTHRTGRGEDDYRRYDFMIYKGIELVEPATIWPNSKDNLLSHTNKQEAKKVGYFSDHAILRGKFGLIMFPIAYNEENKRYESVLIKDKKDEDSAVLCDRKTMFEGLEKLGTPISFYDGDLVKCLFQPVKYDAEKFKQRKLEYEEKFNNLVMLIDAIKKNAESKGMTINNLEASDVARKIIKAALLQGISLIEKSEDLEKVKTQIDKAVEELKASNVPGAGENPQVFFDSLVKFIEEGAKKRELGVDAKQMAQLMIQSALGKREIKDAEELKTVRRNVLSTLDNLEKIKARQPAVPAFPEAYTKQNYLDFVDRMKKVVREQGGDQNLVEEILSGILGNQKIEDKTREAFVESIFRSKISEMLEPASAGPADQLLQSLQTLKSKLIQLSQVLTGEEEEGEESIRSNQMDREDF